MIAGTLAGAGYYMGKLFPAKPANPRGYFEDSEINEINEELIAPLVPRRPSGRLGRLFPRRHYMGSRWLAQLPVDRVPGPVPSSLAPRIERHVQREPFCFKDPRFSYTLPAWRPFLRDPVFICVFREPNRTAQSIMENVRTETYLHPLRFGYEDALKTWTLMYRHVLERHRMSGEWLFVHYDQVLDGDGATRIATAVGAGIDAGFPDSSLKRSPATGEVPPETADVYARLCALAGYRPSTEPRRQA
jgi:hypothetical protein